MNNDNHGIFDRMVKALDANYVPLVVFHLKDKDDIKLGDAATKRTCRFCGRTEPEVTFKKWRTPYHTLSEIGP